MNAALALLGVAAVFGVAPQDDARRAPEWRGPLSADDFRTFINLGVGVPLRARHETVWTPAGGVATVGTVRRLRIVEGHPTLPNCLLALAELDPGPVGYSLLESLARERWGMSVAVVQQWSSATWQAGSVVEEVSLSQTPAFPQALVLGVGLTALDRWELLTGETALAVS